MKLNKRNKILIGIGCIIGFIYYVNIKDTKDYGQVGTYTVKFEDSLKSKLPYLFKEPIEITLEEGGNAKINSDLLFNFSKKGYWYKTDFDEGFTMRLNFGGADRQLSNGSVKIGDTLWLDSPFQNDTLRIDQVILVKKN